MSDEYTQFLVGWNCPCALWSTTPWMYMPVQPIPLYILTPLCKMEEIYQLHVPVCSAIAKQASWGHQIWYGWLTQMNNFFQPPSRKYLWFLGHPTCSLFTTLTELNPTSTHLNICDYQWERIVLSHCDWPFTFVCVSCNTWSCWTIVCFVCMCKSAHTRTSLACESASGSSTREPGSDIFHHTLNRPSPALATPHTDEFDSSEPEPSRTR
jgi:hypothetical protein